MQFTAWVKLESREWYEFWIGLTDSKEEGRYEWRSRRSLSPQLGRHWKSGEPDNYRVVQLDLTPEIDVFHILFERNTLSGVPSCVRFCRQEFGEFPRLVGRYCSYLRPKQAGGTPQILVN